MQAVQDHPQSRAMALAAVGLIVAALPVFLTGALAVQIRADLGFGETALGAAMTAFFVGSGLGSVPGGKIADRIGFRRAMRVGSAGTVAALALAASAQSWAVLAASLALGGLSLGLTEPGIALAIARLVSGPRQGLAFGVKEAAIPGATLVAGAAVPVVALTVGWRWAYVVAIVLVPVLWALIPASEGHRATSAAAESRESSPPITVPAPGAAPLPRALWVVAAGAGFGIAAVTAMGAFLVEAAVATGLPPGRAGLLLSAGSLGGIAGRVAAGWVADRTAKPQLPVVACMLLVGAGALMLLSLASASGPPRAGPLLLIGVVPAFGLGWAWSGLLFLSAVQASPGAAAGAAGVMLAGLSLGGASGPLLFGVIVATASFSAAWAAGAAAMVAGALLVSVGGRMLAARRSAPAPG